MWRQRIRLTMGNRYGDSEQFNLHDQEMMYPEHRFWEHVKVCNDYLLLQIVRVFSYLIETDHDQFVFF